MDHYSSQRSERHVRFNELNTKEGQRLFEGRQQLRDQNMRPSQIQRTDGENALRRFFARNPITAPYTRRRAWSNALFLGLLTGVVALTLGYALMTIIAAAAVTAGARFWFGSRIHAQVQDTANRLRNNSESSNQWLTENQEQYTKGYQSRSWSPYLKSYLDRSTYGNTAYFVGLEDAMDRRPEIRVRTR